MIFRIEDIVFQNDRYYLLFTEMEAEKMTDMTCLDIYADHVKIKQLSSCSLSEILKIPGHVVLETKENLSELERIFRKSKVVEICTCIKNVNHK